ncbi:hypothetical protein SAMD00023353_0104870 [Rosellinia necatrix]|uniref:Uncharacterized protein n=1 Tax=Rosellinia necatrix TaxID=77044 RepID=A0A1S7UI97_ROSNE|nr:hypothetical protein SAMD00023353_0104870 [Rosellinia necatrix]
MRGQTLIQSFRSSDKPQLAQSSVPNKETLRQRPNHHLNEAVLENDAASLRSTTSFSSTVTLLREKLTPTSQRTPPSSPPSFSTSDQKRLMDTAFQNSIRMGI